MLFSSVKKNTIIDNKRKEYIDIAKGIGLLLVAWAHSRGPYYYKIYLFHMPFFVLISGYLHKSETNTLLFIKKRLISLYVPFVFWNILTSFIRYCFGLIKGKSLLKLIPKVLLTIDKDGVFLGASWFLPSLLLISIAYKLLESLLCRTTHSDIYITVTFFIVGITGFIVTLPFMLSRTLILSIFYSVGAFLKKHNLDISNLFTVDKVLVSLVVFFCLLPGNSANMGANQYSAPLGFLCTSLLGSFLLLYVAHRLELSEKRLFCVIKNFILFIQKWSIYIIIFTFIGAYIVNILLNMPLEISLLEFIRENKAIGDTSGLKWFLYFLGSVFFPILIGYILNCGALGKILRAIHAIPEIRKQQKQ